MKEFYLYKTIIKLRLKSYEVLSVLILFPIILTVIFMQVFSNLESGPQVEGALAIYTSHEQMGEYYTEALTALGEESESIRLDISVIEDRDQADIILDMQNNKIILNNEQIDEELMQLVLPVTESFVAQMEIDYTLQAPYEFITLSTTSVPMWMTIGITMIMFTSLLGGQYGITQVVDLRKPIGIRLSHLALSKKRIYLIYGLASVTLLFGQLFLVCMGYQFIFGIALWNRLDLLVIILLLMSILSVTIGTVIAIWAHDEGVASGMLSGFVTVACMLSGGMMPNIDMPIAKLNPIRHIIDALIQIAQEGKVDGFLTLCISLIGAILVLAGIGLIKLRKERG